MTNKVVLEGRLTGSPVRISGGSISQVMFKVETSELLVDRYTEQQTTVSQTHQCIAWGETADFVDNACENGSTVRVTGRNETITKYIGHQKISFSRVEACSGVSVVR